MFGRNSFVIRKGASKLVFNVMMLSLYEPSATARPRDKPALLTTTVSWNLGFILFLLLTKDGWITNFEFYLFTNGCNFSLVAEIALMVYDAFGSCGGLARDKLFLVQ